MILDSQWILSDAQAITALGNTDSTNVIDLGHSQEPFTFGRGNPVPLLAQVTETFTSGGAGTLQFTVRTADDAALTVNVATVWNSPVYALASLKAGFQVPGLEWFPNVGPLVNGNDVRLRRYVGVRYVVGTAAMTAGRVTFGLTSSVQTHRA